MNINDKIAQIEIKIRENGSIHEADKLQMLRNIQKIRKQKVNILITGATGCGKSSTINALFGDDVAKVGGGVDPETQTIQEYHLGNLVIWDSPGLGDGKENDKRHASKIIDLLQKTDENGDALIDMALLILDAGQKDYGTSYELLTKILIPYLGDARKDRILVAINQADRISNGRKWDHETNQPTPSGILFLDEKTRSTQKRINESTGVNIEPIYYSAGFKDDDEIQRPYNLSKLLYFIIQHTPEEKAAVITLTANPEEEMWGEREEDREYQEKISAGLINRVISGAKTGSEIGGKLGSAFGPVGATTGRIIGGIVGGIMGLFS